MSIGGEDVKGSEFTKDIFKLLKRSKLNFRGNVEGHDLFENPVEVVLCDGFVGQRDAEGLRSHGQRGIPLAEA